MNASNDSASASARDPFLLPSGTVPVEAQQLAELKLSPGAMRAVRVVGRSMEPTIMDGARVVVDISNRRPIDGMVYAIATDGGPLVKRLKVQPFGGAVIAASDNRDYADIPMSEGDVAQIIGRVVLAINPVGALNRV
jgi:phage repressor protein C with HTH and peptisase S24 domain